MKDKLLKVLKRKKVYIGCLEHSTLKQYNIFMGWLLEDKNKLTKNEYNLIMGWLNGTINL